MVDPRFLPMEEDQKDPLDGPITSTNDSTSTGSGGNPPSWAPTPGIPIERRNMKRSLADAPPLSDGPGANSQRRRKRLYTKPQERIPYVSRQRPRTYKEENLQPPAENPTQRQTSAMGLEQQEKEIWTQYEKYRPLFATSMATASVVEKPCILRFMNIKSSHVNLRDRFDAELKGLNGIVRSYGPSELKTNLATALALLFKASRIRQIQLDHSNILDRVNEEGLLTNNLENRYDGRGDGQITMIGAGESYRPSNRPRSPLRGDTFRADRDRSPPRRARTPLRDRGRSPIRDRARTPPRDRARTPPLASDSYYPGARNRSPIRRRSRSPGLFRARDRDRTPQRDLRDIPNWRARERQRSPPPRRLSPRRDEWRDRPRSPRRDDLIIRDNRYVYGIFWPLMDQ
jgi:hypothetical protein